MLVAPPPCAPSPPLKLPRSLCKSVKHHNLSSLPGLVNILMMIVMDMTMLVKMVLACPIVQFACVSSPIGVSFKCFWLILREMLFGWIGTFAIRNVETVAFQQIALMCVDSCDVAFSCVNCSQSQSSGDPEWLCKAIKPWRKFQLADDGVKSSYQRSEGLREQLPRKKTFSFGHCPKRGGGPSAR